MRNLHVANEAHRNATVAVASVKAAPGPHAGKDGQPVTFRRYISAGEGTLDVDLLARFDGPYARQLIEGDPEIDVDSVGRFIDRTVTVLLDGGAEPLFRAPEVVEISYAPDGTETGRKPPEDALPTIDDVIPMRWTGRLLSRADMVRRFAVRRTLRLRHVDGVTYDFLHSMAAELDASGKVVLMGGGESGKDPIVFTVNGAPYRGFLDGRVDGPRYRLLLHLSNMELKTPPPVMDGAAEKGATS